MTLLKFTHTRDRQSYYNLIIICNRDVSTCFLKKILRPTRKDVHFYAKKIGHVSGKFNCRTLLKLLSEKIRAKIPTKILDTSLKLS